jgi:thymidylate synthase (methanogen type)
LADLGDIWKEYLWDIYSNGHKHIKDDGDKIKEILGVHIFLDHPQNSLLFSVSSANQYLSLIQNGALNISGYSLKDLALYEYVNSWNNQELIINPDFIYTYPERLFNMHTYDDSLFEDNWINQYEVIIDRLKNYDGSNRAVAVLYNAGLDKDQQHIPCLNFLQAIIRNGSLTLFCMFRSNDIFNAWPSNMMLLTHLGLMLADALDVEFEGIDYHCSSAHYYLTEEPMIKEMFKWKT